MTNKVKTQKFKQKKDPKTNFISSILANFNNEKINLSKRTLISSLLVNADKFKLNIHTKHIDDLNQSNYNSISNTMNIQSKHSLTFELDDFTEKKQNLVTNHSTSKQNKDLYYLKRFEKLDYEKLQNNNLTKNKSTKIKLKMNLKSLLYFYQYIL